MDGTHEWPDNVDQARMLRILRDEGERSRAQLGDATGLTGARAALEIDRLTARGLIEHGGPAVSRGGRRSSLVRLATGTRLLSIALGAHSLEVVVTDGELRPLARACERSDLRRGPALVLGRACELAAKLLLESGGDRFSGAGIGIPGPVSFRDGAPVAPPFLPGWHRFGVRELLATELCCPVLVDNDVNLLALGEKHAGVGKPFDTFLFVKIGSGIGAGLIVDGEVYRGADGSAGDIGHTAVSIGQDDGPDCLCGNTGCLEAYFGGAALSRDALTAVRAGRSAALAERLARSGTLTAHDVADAATHGDPVAVALVRDGGHRVGQVLATMVSFFNPGLIVIGGGLAGIGHSLLAEIRSVVYRASLPLASRALPIVLSELGTEATHLGAARMVSDHLLEVPGARSARR
ncbi:MAG: ROK family transcriptional regulator [Actinoplanes sp.]